MRRKIIQNWRLRIFNSETGRHFFVQESFAGAIGLDPFAVDNELGNSTLASPLYDFGGGSGSGGDVHFFIRNVVLRQKALGFAAVGTPR